LCLKLAELHSVELRHLVGDHRHVLLRDRVDRRHEDITDPAKHEGATAQSAAEHQSRALAALKETISQVTAVAGRGVVDTRRPGTIGLLRSIGGGELSRARREAVRLEAEALVQLASLYLSIGDVSSCEQETLKLAQLETTVEEKSQFVIHPVGDTLDILANVRPAASIMADLMYAKHDFETASKHLESILVKHPTDYSTLAKLVDALRRCGNLNKIPVFLDRTKAADPMGETSPGYNFCRGLYHRITGESTLALKCFNQSRLDCGLNEEAIYHMVEIALNPNNQLPTDDSDDIMNDGGMNNANSNSLRHVSAFPQNGSVNQSDNGTTATNGLQTAEHLLKELPNSKNNKRHRFLSNMLLLMTGSKPNVNTALERFAQMAQEEPDSGAVIYGAAACYVVLKQTQKARNQLKRLAKVPWNVQEAEELEKAWLLLADIYIQSGKTDMSQELLKRCLQYNKVYVLQT
uniref:TPR_REGION domain-containing protein n=1 Tax=Echinostoma caproni TaxID=27848 RepID=A0A183AJA7_9TREM